MKAQCYSCSEYYQQMQMRIIQKYLTEVFEFARTRHNTSVTDHANAVLQRLQPIQQQLIELGAHNVDSNCSKYRDLWRQWLVLYYQYGY